MPLALLIAAALQAAPAEVSELGEMRRAYAEDCLQRDYGSFDDICSQLADQIRVYARTHPDIAAATPSAARAPAASPTRAAPGLAASGAQKAASAPAVLPPDATR